jgi:hypothetical protein
VDRIELASLSDAIKERNLAAMTAILTVVGGRGDLRFSEPKTSPGCLFNFAAVGVTSPPPPRRHGRAGHASRHRRQRGRALPSAQMAEQVSQMADWYINHVVLGSVCVRMGSNGDGDAREGSSKAVM